MNFERELTREFSKIQVIRLTDYIGADEDRFAQLMHVFFNGPYVATQKASWVLSECADRHPFLIIPYFERFIQQLQEPGITDAVKRNIVRVWQNVEIPEEFIGEVYDICYSFMNSTESIAVRAFSMTVCHHISKQLPELRTELRLTIEDLMLKNQDGSAAIKSRGRKILAHLKKK